jgi:pimeloyl-ACP methyl ester carboxylesterase
MPPDRITEDREKNYLDVGQGTPVVMIPGMEGSRYFWRFQVDELGKRYRVVSCDLARRKPRLSSTVADYAREVLDTMDRLGIDRAVIVGESMGGVVSQEIATAHPERVLALVLCNTMDRPRRGGFGFNMFTLATFVHQFAFLPFLSDEGRRRLLRWVGKHRGFVLDPSPGNEDLIDYLMQYGLDCGGAAYVDRIIAMSKIDYTDKLSGIAAPTLVLRGTEDRLVGAETIVQLAGAIPGAELVLIEGGGHCCQHTVPGATSRALMDWLERIGL